jgi:hypothetical protein
MVRAWNVTRLEDPEKTDKKEKKITLTCPICEQELSFVIPVELTRTKPRIVKKAVKHDNQHVVVVHFDSDGNVKKMYGYQCTEISSRPLSSDSSCVTVNLSNKREIKLVNDPEGFLRTLLEDMEKLSREKVYI